MSDPSLEEESLISQDDIDRLMDASSIEDAEEQIDAGNDSLEPDLDDLGELSQDDIDSLLNGTSLDGAGSENSVSDQAQEAGQEQESSELSQDDIDSLMGSNDAVADDGGELSQDDIDSLMGGNAAADAPDEGGELSQDDIDSLMGGNAADEGGELSQDDIDSLMNGPDDSSDSDEEDLELISQDDIDRLMTSPDPDEPEKSGDNIEDDSEDDDEQISLDDIQALISADADDDNLSEPEPIGEDSKETPEVVLLDEEPSAEEDLPAMDEPIVPEDPAVPETQKTKEAADQDSLDDVIDESDAMEVADCLMTQETMDELISNASQPDSGVVDLEAALPPDAIDPEPVEQDAVDLSDLEDPDIGIDGQEGDELTDALSNDMDPVLEDEDIDLLDLGLDSEDDSDVTQEDIDALLQDSDDDEDILDEDDILISQDDIDTLLMAADQEDEDVLGEALTDGFDEGDFDSEEFIESYEEDELDSDQVVLEETAESQDIEDEASRPVKLGKLGTLLKSKLVLASASAILVLMISVPSVYFLFFSKKTEPLPQRESVPQSAQEGTRDLEIASVTIEEEEVLLNTRRSGTIVLADFVILASELSKKMTYVYADISIDYSDQRAYHEISNNLSFYRDLIYESIQTRLVSEKQDELTEADLIWGVENSLKKVLPPHYIKKISFKTFRTS